MTAEDHADAERRTPAGLKSRTETLLAAAVKELGASAPPANPKATPFTFPMDRAWALATDDDLRTLVVTRALQTLGGTAFHVTADDQRLAISPAPNPRE